MNTWLAKQLARLSLGYPRAILIIALLISVASGLLSTRLVISSDRNLLAGKNDPSAKRRDEVNELFGTTLTAAVIIEGQDDVAALQQAADALGKALTKRTDLVRDVFVKADINFFERHALMFMPEEALRGLVDQIAGDQLGLKALEQSDNLPSLVTAWAEHMADVPLPADANNDEITGHMNSFGGVIDAVNTWLAGQSDEMPDLVGHLYQDGSSMGNAAGSDGYLLDNDGQSPRLAILFVQPVSNAQAMEVVEPFTQFIRDEAARVLADYPGFQYRVTGMPALTTDEMRVVARDVLFTGAMSGLAILLVFGLLLRSFRVTIIAGISLSIGILWAAGFTALVFGRLTIVSGYFAAQLLGLGVGYTIYIISRFHEALLEGLDRTEAAKVALTRAGPGVLGSALTSAVAFGAIILSDFRGFVELGIIAGCGTIWLLLSNLLVLPAILRYFHPGVGSVRPSAQSGPLFLRLSRTPVALAIAGIALSLLGLTQLPKVRFDYAVESLLPSAAESVKGLKLLDTRTDYSTNYSVSITDNIEAAEALRQKFAQLPTVARAEALSMFVPSDQAQRVALLSQLGADEKGALLRSASAVSNAHQRAGTATAQGLGAALTELRDVIEDLALSAQRTGREPVAKSLRQLASKLDTSLTILTKQSDNRRVQQLEQNAFALLDRGMRVLSSAVDAKPFTATDLPAELKGRYLSQNEKVFAVIVFPTGDIADKTFFETHVNEVLSVDPGATGHPVTHLAFTQLIHRGFARAAILAAIAVIFVVLLDLREPRYFALAILPLVLGTGWVAGVMGLTGLSFNYANLMAIPILIGTGVDFGINLAQRARQEGSIRAAVRTTGKAIAISGTATTLGFGALILGQHWGVKSLGLSLSLGIVSCLVLTLAIVPALLERDKTKA
ncbi:MAG: MMPL family transporter [Proteobacteria bacterium]|nr:MMPL family transporter [Pseudomonadota bacterium]